MIHIFNCYSSRTILSGFFFRVLSVGTFLTYMALPALSQSAPAKPVGNNQSDQDDRICIKLEVQPNQHGFHTQEPFYLVAHVTDPHKKVYEITFMRQIGRTQQPVVIGSSRQAYQVNGKDIECRYFIEHVERKIGQPIFSVQAHNAKGVTIFEPDATGSTKISSGREETSIVVPIMLDNGIRVGHAKIFDRRTLLTMLDSARSAFAQTQFPNTNTLFGSVGNFQGGIATANSQAFNLLGLPTPNITTVLSNGATNTANTTTGTNNTNNVSYALGTNNTATTNQSNMPTSQTVTTVPAGSMSTPPGVVVTTTTTATSQAGTTANTTTNTNTSGTTTNTTGSNNTNIATNGFNQTSTQPSFTPTLPVLPGQLSAFGASPGTSLEAQTLLSKQLSLYNQLTSLSLLAEGALSDRIVEYADPNKKNPDTGKVDTNVVPRSQPVIGFTVTLDPKQYIDAVAQVDITIVPDTNNVGKQERPFVVSMIPQANTYNVAATRSSASSIGFGVVLESIALQFGSNRQRQTQYLLADIDTVALRDAPRVTNLLDLPGSIPDKEALEPAQLNSSAALTFGWQFRPVLGKHQVDPGERQVYAVIGLPVGNNIPWLGHVFMRTSWHSIVKHGDAWMAVGPPIPGSTNWEYAGKLFVPPAYQYIRGLNEIDNVLWEDAGGGNVAVIALGQFQPNSSVNLGSRLISTGQPAMIAQSSGRIKFVAPAAELMMNRAQFVDRTGFSGDINIPKFWFKLPPVHSQAPDKPATQIQKPKADDNSLDQGLEIVSGPDIQRLDATNSRLTIKIKNKNAKLRIFGVRPTPFESMFDVNINKTKLNDDTSQPKELFNVLTDSFESVGQVGSPPPHKPLILIGTQVFGLSNAPYSVKPCGGQGKPEDMDALWNCVELKTIVPTQILQSAGQLTVKDLFWGSHYEDTIALSVPDNVAGDFTATKLDVLSERDDATVYAVSGTHLEQVKRILIGDEPVDPIKPIGTAGIALTMLYFKVNKPGVVPVANSNSIAQNSKQASKTNKQQKSNAQKPQSARGANTPAGGANPRPVKNILKGLKAITLVSDTATVILPVKPAPVTSPKPVILQPGPVISLVTGTSKTMLIEGSHLDSIATIQLVDGTNINFDAKNETSLTIYITSALTGTSGTKIPTVTLKDGTKIPDPADPDNAKPILQFDVSSPNGK